jgi:hypothetical protein
LASALTPPDCALPFAFFLLLLFFFFLAAKGMPRQPDPLSSGTVEWEQQWICDLPDLLIESEALAADIFNICSYNEHVCNRSLASFNLASWEVRDVA